MNIPDKFAVIGCDSMAKVRSVVSALRFADVPTFDDGVYHIYVDEAAVDRLKNDPETKALLARLDPWKAGTQGHSEPAVVVLGCAVHAVKQYPPGCLVIAPEHAHQVIQENAKSWPRPTFVGRPERTS